MTVWSLQGRVYVSAGHYVYENVTSIVYFQMALLGVLLCEHD